MYAFFAMICEFQIVFCKYSQQENKIFYKNEPHIKCAIKLYFSGGCCGSENKRTIVGGYAWAWACVTDTQR